METFFVLVLLALVVHALNRNPNAAPRRPSVSARMAEARRIAAGERSNPVATSRR